MTRINREIMLHITEMVCELPNITVSPHDEDPVIMIDQDEDRIVLDRDGARALGEFLVEWSTPKPDATVFIPVLTCTFCEMPVTAGEALRCRKPGCPAKEKFGE